MPEDLPPAATALIQKNMSNSWVQNLEAPELVEKLSALRPVAPAAGKILPFTSVGTSTRISLGKTYDELLNRWKAEGKFGTGFNNLKTALKSFLEDISPNSPLSLRVGDEMMVGFIPRLDAYMAKCGLEEGSSQFRNRKSLLNKIHEAIEIEIHEAEELATHACQGRPKFSEKFSQLVAKSGMTQRALAEKANVERSMIYYWSSGNAYPSRRSFDAIARLEAVFGEAPGSLTQYIFKGGKRRTLETGTTAWGEHLRGRHRDRYRWQRRDWTQRVQGEWIAYHQSKTEDPLSETSQRSPAAGWDNDELELGTVDIEQKLWESFFGYLRIHHGTKLVIKGDQETNV